MLTTSTTSANNPSGDSEGGNRVAVIIVGSFVLMTVSIMLFIPVIEYLRVNGCPRRFLCWRCDEGCCACCSYQCWLHPSAACLETPSPCCICDGCHCDWSACTAGCVYWGSGRACCDACRRHRDKDDDYV